MLLRFVWSQYICTHLEVAATVLSSSSQAIVVFGASSSLQWIQESVHTIPTFILYCSVHNTRAADTHAQVWNDIGRAGGGGGRVASASRHFCTRYCGGSGSIKRGGHYITSMYENTTRASAWKMTRRNIVVDAKDICGLISNVYACASRVPSAKSVFKWGCCREMHELFLLTFHQCRLIFRDGWSHGSFSLRLKLKVNLNACVGVAGWSEQCEIGWMTVWYA